MNAASVSDTGVSARVRVGVRVRVRVRVRPVFLTGG